jgi:hypothetical protein
MTIQVTVTTGDKPARIHIGEDISYTSENGKTRRTGWNNEERFVEPNSTAVCHVHDRNHVTVTELPEGTTDLKPQGEPLCATSAG